MQVSCDLSTGPNLPGHKSSPRRERPIVLNAKAFIPPNTHVFGSGDMWGAKLADTIDSYLVGVLAWTGLAGFADLREHGVWLMKRRGRHGVCRRCNGEGKGDTDQQSDHCSPDKRPSAESQLRTS